MNAAVWVHPSDGYDDPDLTHAMAYVNDPSQKFRTLQRAIDVLQLYLVGEYDPVDNPDQQGIVYALPGTYGPSTYGPASGDVLPIVMRDRVHVQGLGARRCTLRGASTTTVPVTNRQFVWPDGLCANAANPVRSVEVLLTFAESTPDSLIYPSVPNVLLPWFSGYYQQERDTPETLDGFTFQGGDVQVLLTNKLSGANYFPAARISNCLFDLRHGILVQPTGTTALAGPYFGLMMKRVATWDSNAPVMGYLDSRVLVAQNTFLFARWDDATSNGGWESESRPETVGLIDFTDPNTQSSLGGTDPDCSFRGVGNPCITGNLFRTRPVSPSASIKPFAMLGIGSEDTQVLSASVYKNTNAFDPSRVGATNGYFYSAPVVAGIVSASTSAWVHWNCQGQASPPGACGTSCTSGCSASTFPVPQVSIWDGTTGKDPAFVGEFVSTLLTSSQTPPTDYDYIDWRLMPGSPLENQSVSPGAGGPRGFVTAPHAGDPAWVFPTEFPEECALFRWDGEHWGNPRIADLIPDIGFDERGLVIQAGNWANGSNSHNQPGFMHPTGVGDPTRWFILPQVAGGVTLSATNHYLRLHDTTVTPVGTSPGNAWIQPPGALSSPPNLGSLPVGYRTKYISFASTATADMALGGSALTWDPLGNVTGQSSASFVLVSFLDDECTGGACAHSYYNVQGIIVEVSGGSAELLRGNLQGEYR